MTEAQRSMLARCGALGLALTLYAPGAHAYCRTTTCDPIADSDHPDEACQPDATGCLTRGRPLFWRTSSKHGDPLCITFAVQERGSPLRGISFESANEIVSTAFQTWVSADCGGETQPGIRVVSLGSVVCDQPEYNADPPEPNANIVMFRDDDWPYEGVDSVIALTTISFDPSSGQIFDADIEVNSYGLPIATDGDNAISDLQSVLTHEVGHFFGLAHTCSLEDDDCAFDESVMNASYRTGDIAVRELSDDDERGICSVYPGVAHQRLPQSCPADTAPTHGFSRYCGTGRVAGGCSAPPGGHTSGYGPLLVVGLAVWLSRRRRASLRPA